MKINMILPALGHSGGVQMAVDYLNYFSKHNNDVICYVPFTGAYYGWKKILFVKAIYRLLRSKDLQGKWINSSLPIKFVPYINNYHIRNADVTIATSWLTSYWVEKLSRQKGAKVYFIQDFETWGNADENKKVKQSYQLPYDLRISVSTELHDRLLTEAESKSVIVCNGIHEKNILTSLVARTNKVVIGMPYRERRSIEQDIKNTQFGIESLLAFKRTNPTIKLKSFGFKKPNDFSTQIEFLENPTRVELNQWYDSVDIFYVPSLYEGWGLPAMEAMARGCVVMGANTGCLREFGNHMQNCYLLSNMRDRQKLFTGLKTLIENGALRKQIGHEALKTVKKYSFEKEATQFLSLLKSVKY